MADNVVLVAQPVVVEEQLVFTLTTLCQATRADSWQVQALVLEGLLHPTGRGPDDWQFSGHALRQARTALRLERELALSWAGVAIVMDLMAEVAALKAQLRRR